MTDQLVLLSLDVAARTGWSVIGAPSGQLLARGVCTGALAPLAHQARLDVITRAQSCTDAHPLPLRVVMEDHTQIPLARGTKRDGANSGTRTTGTLIGMGKARGRWEIALAVSAVRPWSTMLAIPPKEWRTAVLGARFARAPADVAKAEAIRWVLATYGVNADKDEAESIAMGAYAARSRFRELLALGH